MVEQRVLIPFVAGSIPVIPAIFVGGSLTGKAQSAAAREAEFDSGYEGSSPFLLPILGDRLMAGREFLKLVMGVRIPLSQPCVGTQSDRATGL